MNIANDVRTLKASINLRINLNVVLPRRLGSKRERRQTHPVSTQHMLLSHLHVVHKINVYAVQNRDAYT